MTSSQQPDHLTRESVLKLLSAEEAASVSTAETATRLLAGDEYLDLDKLDAGVQHAVAMKVPVGELLPRKAVPETTWRRILTQLATPAT